MEYLKASMLFGVWSSGILFLLYIILYKVEEQEFLKLWSISLALKGATYILDYNVFGLSPIELKIIPTIRQITLMLSIYLSIKGIYLFINKVVNKVTIAALTLLVIPNILIINKHPNYLTNILIIFVGIFFLNLYIIFYEFDHLKENIFYLPMKISLIAMSLLDIILVLSNYLDIHDSIVIGVYTCNQLVFYLSALFVKFEQSKLDLIKTQKELLQSEKKLKTIIENQRDVIFELDSDGKFCFISDSINDVFQYSSKELMGKNISELINFDIDNAMVKCNILGQREISSKTKDGKNIYINMNWKMVRDEEDNFMGVIGTIRDITQSKKLEDLMSVDKLKTEFLTNISHDIKTPLSIINGTVQLMDLQAKIKQENYISKHTQIIRKNVFRLLKLINNFIDLSKIEGGYGDIHRENCNVVQVVEDTVMSAADYVKSKDIILEFDTTEEEIIAAVDIDKMERVILNLLSNAVKFTPKEGKIFINMRKEESNIIIGVRDTGRGIPEDQINNVFERYSQIEDGDEVFHKGSGIGLSIVKSFIELHDGKVWVESVVGVGSEFIISIPIIVTMNSQSSLKANIGDKINIELSDL